ncbi:carboxyl-terminal processing protease [Rhodoblastus sphagnicola]|nr:S41 family peptidase [Rhodoblastus sphagnicola]MBB4197790.1 carboxyl-terminal processing protease [Rhodoblastus sphagnicola]
MRKTSLVLLGVVVGASVASIGARVPFSTPWAPAGAHAASSDVYRSLNLFGDVFEKVRTDYVEKPDDKKMVEAAVSGMLASLDPHSSYMDAKSFQDMQIQTQGKFGGLGIEVMQEDGLVKVVAPIDDTPAARAGILSGDFITAIDDEAVQGMSLNQAVDKMRGEVNTNVKLTLARGAKKDKVEVTLTRAVIQIKSVRSRVEAPDIGYIRVTQFTEQTYEGLKDAMQKLQKDIPAEKFKGFVIDLRNNPGGLLDQSVAVVNAFIDHGEIVSTRGRNADETQRYNARPIDLSKGKPVVVLINGGSASASEIVAGALQDHKRATLIGTRSFGKGSVQTIIPLGMNNGALRLTTARYYTPSGRSIQAKGIEPDLTVLEDVPDDLKGKDKTEGEASLKGHLKNGDDEAHGSQAYVPPDAAKDKALHAALDLLRGVKTAEAIKAENAKPVADVAKPNSEDKPADKSENKSADKPSGRPAEAPPAAPPVRPQGEPVLKPAPTPAPVPEK